MEIQVCKQLWSSESGFSRKHLNIDCHDWRSGITLFPTCRLDQTSLELRFCFFYQDLHGLKYIKFVLLVKSGRVGKLNSISFMVMLLLGVINIQLFVKMYNFFFPFPLKERRNTPKQINVSIGCRLTWVSHLLFLRFSLHNCAPSFFISTTSSSSTSTEAPSPTA